MMARYDKYDPKVGGFRAPLAAEFPEGDNKENLGRIFPASLNADGAVVTDGSGQSGVVGILILTKRHDAGDIVDIMTAGEVVEYANEDGSAASPGTVQNVGGVRVGHTVESTRLVVRVVPAAAAAGGTV